MLWYENMSMETTRQASPEETDKIHLTASNTSIGAPSDYELDIVDPNKIDIINAPDKLNWIRQQILNPEQGMPHPVGAEIVIEAIQSTLESELAGLRGNNRIKALLRTSSIIRQGRPSIPPSDCPYIRQVRVTSSIT